jgi:phage repressor protein C with HTH and peptisase S24 domain
MDIVRELIKKQLEEARLSMSEALLKIGRNASYLQQFLRRGVPEELHEKERLKLAELLGIDENQLRGKSIPLTSRPYIKNGDRLHSQAPSAISVTSGKQIPLDSPRFFPISEMTQDLPVFATTQVAGGAMIMSVKPIDRIARPNFLVHVDGAYGLIIPDDAMSPEAKSGSTALVHPHLPARDGDTCLFQSKQETGTAVLMRQLVRSNDRNWRVHQHKPAKDYDLKKTEWPVCHLVVGNFSRR